MTTTAEAISNGSVDPVMMSVLSNRLDGIVREMSNTLLKAARSTVIAIARDFSCAIVTYDNQLLAAAEGLPIHIFGADLMCEAMTRLHPGLAEGDAFIHNDPYLGGSHAADQTILVPVFIEGKHLFTVCVKAHQADIGNSIPTTYHLTARDVYEEGAVIFPCMKLQSQGKMIEDVIRLGMTRIRVPQQWYGDLLAAVGSARIGEKRLKALCEKYSRASIKHFISAWFDYSEQRAIQAIAALPAGTVENEAALDPFPPVIEDPIPVRVKVTVDPVQGRITVDLRDNIDCLPCGLNQSEACAISSAMIGIFNCLDPDLPQNAGSFRRLRVLLRDGAIVGKVKHPFSASVATTAISDYLVSTTQSAIAKLGYGYGISDISAGGSYGAAVVSGRDSRYDNEPYVNQLCLFVGGGPASAHADGWATYAEPVVNGLIYRDSIELDELKHPLLIDHLRLVPDSGGAGYRRGGLALDIEYGPRQDPITLVGCSSGVIPGKGVHGGHPGRLGVCRYKKNDGTPSQLPYPMLMLQPGETVSTIESSGGGYGYPHLREPERVLNDVLSSAVTVDAAYEIYQVVLVGRIEDESLAVDITATDQLRAAHGSMPK